MLMLFSFHFRKELFHTEIISVQLVPTYHEFSYSLFFVKIFPRNTDIIHEHIISKYTVQMYPFT